MNAAYTKPSSFPIQARNWLGEMVPVIIPHDAKPILAWNDTVFLGLRENGTFIVVYGLQVDNRCTYEDASLLFMDCVGHAMECLKV